MLVTHSHSTELFLAFVTEVNIERDNPASNDLRLSTLFAVVLTIFLGVHLLLSLALSGSFSPDDADQLIFSQTLARGYYEQAPLYSWLSYLFLHLFGVTFFGYYLLKSLALGSIYAASFLCARSLLGDSRGAVAAAFSPLLIPTFGWHSFSYLTNTNLVCAATAATYYLLVQLQRYGRWSNYLLLGLTLGLGLLSKYNFLLVAIAFFAAGLTIASLRAKLLDYRILWALGIAALLALPNAVWLFDHRSVLILVLSDKLYLNGAAGLLEGRIRGVFSLVSDVFLILLPAAVFFLFFRRLATPLHPVIEAQLFLGRFLLAGLGVQLILVVVSGESYFHERWLQPFAFLVPLLGLSCYRFASRHALRVLQFVLLTCALAYAGARCAQVFIGGFDRGAYPLQMNFSLAAVRLRPLIQPGTVVVSRDREIAGNLRYQFPSVRHLCSSHPLYIPTLRGFDGPRILVWNAKNGNTPPPDLEAFAAQTLGLQIPASATAAFVDVPPKLAGRRSNRLAYIVLPKEQF